MEAPFGVIKVAGYLLIVVLVVAHLSRNLDLLNVRVLGSVSGPLEDISSSLGIPQPSQTLA